LKFKFIKPCLAIGIILLIIPSGISLNISQDEKEILEFENEIVKNLPIFPNNNYSYEIKKYEEYLAKQHFYIKKNSVHIIRVHENDLYKDSTDSPWPMKCHDSKHTSRSPYSTADNPYDEMWRFESENWFEICPIIASDGTIYIGDSWGGLFAINPDGTRKWKYTLGGQIIGSSPAIGEDGTIYIGSWDWKLYAINPNGTLKWKSGAGGEVYSSPAIGDDGTIYIGAMGPDNNGRISAIAPDGARKWYYDTDNWITSDPAIADDGTIYIGSQDNYLYAMNPNGTLKWRYKTGHQVRGPPSIADDGTIYIGSVDKHLHAVYPNGTMRWKHYVGDEISTNPSIAKDGTIYGCGNKIWAINPNGTRKWTFNMGNGRHVDSSSPAISNDGIIYFGTNIGEGEGGEIIAVNPDGTERWRKKIAGFWVESSPSIAEDGTVYIGSTYNMDKSWLHAFNRADLSADADGPHYGLIDIPVQFTGNGNGGYKPYTYHWDFGDGETSEEQNPTHTYTTPDNYTVTLTVTDNTSNTSMDTTFAWIQDGNTAPDIPSIDGPINGNTETKYDYTFQTSDPEGLHIWYYIEWGDGKDTGWIGPYESGDEIVKGHKWSDQNTYIIRCKSKDPYNEESDWGELTIEIPRSKTKNYQWFLNRFLIMERLLNFLQSNLH
jgi:outer membrane protein assembly factor BamB